jgi:hypothetical protein
MVQTNEWVVTLLLNEFSEDVVLESNAVMLAKMPALSGIAALHATLPRAVHDDLCRIMNYYSLTIPTYSDLEFHARFRMGKSTAELYNIYRTMVI